MCQGPPPILLLFVDFKISRVPKKDAEAYCELPHAAAAVDCRVTVDRRRSEFLERPGKCLVLWSDGSALSRSVLRIRSVTSLCEKPINDQL